MGLRKPAILKQLNGSQKNHPERVNKNEPVVVRGIGPPPAHLSTAAAAAWDEIVGISYAGVLGEGDRIALEMMANLLAEYRDDPPEFPVPKLLRLNAMVQQFGMTPSDRGKINVPKAKTSNPYSEL